MENDRVPEKLKGTVEEVSFYNEDTGFCVAEINTGEEGVTVVGAVGQLTVGTQIECEGTWGFHPSFGRQFKAESVSETLPADAGGILRYLSSGIIRGVREATAAKIVELFGSETFDVIENEPERLAQIKGITKAKARKISQEFKTQFAARETLIELTGLGMSQNEAIKAYGIFKGETLDMVRSNPYRLIGLVRGITFDKADEIASRLDEAPSYDCRAVAGVVHIVRHNLTNGHTCIPRDKIFIPAKNLLGCEDDYVDLMLDEAIEERLLVQKTVNGKEFLFLPEIYQAESSIADRIALMTKFPPKENLVFGSEIKSFEDINGIEFDEKQREAIEIAVTKGLLILTGGPGTGKTTTVKGILSLMRSRAMDVALAAPTGRAAQRMEELTGYEAKTIHRLLGVEYMSDSDTATSFVHNIKNPLDCDAIIVDELSMVDVTLFAALLEAMPLHCRLIMVGDKDQLPPVGAGNVLRDLIDSGVISVIKLDKIFRQAMKSRIITNAHRVVGGEMPVIDNSPESDFFLLKESNPYRAAEKVLSLVTSRIPNSYGINPSDIQVLCPSRIGESGTQNINAVLQAHMNPSSKEKRELKYKGYILREGDRVMQNKNNYDVPWERPNETGQGVFNGDIGVLESIDVSHNRITVLFDDKIAFYNIESVKELELAYAMTVHKSQGSEFGAVIMPLLAVPKQLRYRNLFYTALTRAKTLLILIGSENDIRVMVENDKKSRRYSALKYFIENSGDI